MTRSTARRRSLLGAALCCALAATSAHAADDDARRTPRAAVMAPRASDALLLDIARAGDHWVVAGMRGDILLSSDARQWRQVTVPVDVTITRLRFIDADNGWAIGYDGTILQTRDGGSSWQLLQFDPDWAKPYYDALFFDRDNGLLAGANGTLMRTDDGGRTLHAVESPAFEDGLNLYNLIRLGDDSLLLAGERGFLARSTDRGASWQPLKSPYSGSYFGALPVGDRGALIFGLRGNTFYAADIGSAAVLTPEDIEAMRDAMFDPSGATGDASPVTAVAGWTPLANDAFESLFGGQVTADGRILLFGSNGHVMQADLATATLRRLPVEPDNNINAGAVDDGALLIVGTAGVQRVPLN
ncbi:MAG: YCF48-related protein [Nevskiales bacterium]|nr:YCF48-related protein [Nevskiales bacterium]